MAKTPVKAPAKAPVKAAAKKPTKAPVKPVKKPTKTSNTTGIEKQIAITNSLPIKDAPKRPSAVFIVVAVCTGLLIWGLYKAAQYVPVTNVTPTPVPVVEVTPPEVKSISADTVILRNKNAQTEVRTGGSFSWRFNNPGMIWYGDFAKANGAIGSDGRYAIFASYEDGRKAVENLLFESNQGYREKTFEEAMKKYAPQNEGFNTQYYLITLRKLTGIPMSRPLSEFTAENRKCLIDSLQEIEKFKEGKIELR